jgi:thiol-disulfide isomerase/thioredoxin
VRRAAPLLALLLALALTGCESVGSTGDKGYISGNGQILQYAVADRGDPVDLSGTDLDGEPLDIADLRGRVAVVNFWGAWCGPCQAEAPDLVEVATDPEVDAAFVGVNVRDPSPANAQSFVRDYGIPFPTFWDPDGEALLAFPVSLVRSPPTTVVLDAQGRIAASISGPLPSPQTLRDVITDAGKA